MTALCTPEDLAPISRDGALTPLQRALQAHGMERALWTREVLERRHMDTAIGVVLAGQLELSWHQGDDATVLAALRPGPSSASPPVVISAKPSAPWNSDTISDC